MNERFVCIKVDREERPDVDAIYMDAVQAMTGHGGWPLNVFLHARRRAVLRRHLLPARAAPGHAELARGARRRRARLGRAARGDRGQGRADRRRTCGRRPRSRRPGGASTRRRSTRRVGAAARAATTPSTAASAARRSSRPRRRSSSCCGAASARWRSTRCARWPAAASTTSSAAASPATRSTPAGSSRTSRRCSTTTRCSPAPTCTPGRSPASRLRARLPRDARLGAARAAPAEGGFAQRARRRLRGRGGQVLRLDAGRGARGARRRRATAALAHFGVTEAGNFEGASIPVRATRDPEGSPTIQARLRAAREQRVRPGLDDKRLTSWNALMISALADAGAVLDDAALPRRRDRRAPIPAARPARRRRPPAAQLQPRPRAARRLPRGPRLPARGAADALRGDVRPALVRRGARAGRRRSSSASPTRSAAASSRPPTTTRRWSRGARTSRTRRSRPGTRPPRSACCGWRALTGEARYEEAARGGSGCCTRRAAPPDAFGHLLQAIDFHARRRARGRHRRATGASRSSASCARRSARTSCSPAATADGVPLLAGRGRSTAAPPPTSASASRAAAGDRAGRACARCWAERPGRCGILPQVPMSKLLTLCRARAPSGIAAGAWLLASSHRRRRPARQVLRRGEQRVDPFLPGDAESTKALEVTEELQGGEQAPIVIVYRREGGLTAADRAQIARPRRAQRADRGICGTLAVRRAAAVARRRRRAADRQHHRRRRGGHDPRPDRRLSASASAIPAAGWRSRSPAPAASRRTRSRSSSRSTGRCCRRRGSCSCCDPDLPQPDFFWIPLLAVVFAEIATRAIGYGLTELGVTVNGQCSAILSVLVLGAGTDYALLLLALSGGAAQARGQARGDERALRTAGPAIFALRAHGHLRRCCASPSRGWRARPASGRSARWASRWRCSRCSPSSPPCWSSRGRRAFWRPAIFGCRTTASRIFGDEGADETHGAWRRVGERVSLPPRRVWIGTTAALVAPACFLRVLTTRHGPDAGRRLPRRGRVAGGAGAPRPLLPGRRERGDGRDRARLARDARGGVGRDRRGRGRRLGRPGAGRRAGRRARCC